MSYPSITSYPSVTSSDSFEVRAQRSEARRVVIWLTVLVGMLALTLTRRWLGGVVMGENRLFAPYAGVLAAAIALQVVLFVHLRRANREARLLPGWLWRVSAIADLGVAAALLTIAAFLSPRGAVPALTAPPLLLIPLVVLLSVLRLRPTFTLYTGLAGAAIHLTLAVRALAVTDAAADPVYVAYSCILALIAVAGWFVAREVRNHVREGADEAVARDLADRQVYGMQRDLSVAREIQLGLLP